MNMTHINWDSYQFPIVDSEVRKVAYTDNNNTVAKFGFYDKNYISIDDEGINFCQNCEDPISNNSFLGTTTITPNGRIYFDNSFANASLAFQTNMPNKDSFNEYYKDNILVCDENENTQASFESMSHPTYGQGMRIHTIQKVNNTNYDNGIFLGINPDGMERTLLLDEPSQWRTELRIGGIGTLAQQMPAAKSTTSGQNTLFASQTFTAGVWAITYTANFVANATGYRMVWLASNSSESVLDRYCAIETLAPPSSVALLTGTTIREFTSSTTLRLFAKQGSGTSLSATCGIYALKIK